MASVKNNLTAADYRCPLCRESLVKTQQLYRCSNHHSFDQAKEGYVNLLPVQHKHSKDPGDNKAMVNARRAFLGSGHYQPLVAKILSLYHQFANTTAPLLDAGCGEGYYTSAHKMLSNQVYGVDIAKTAIKLAAKKYPQCFFSVGTLAHLPFADEFFAWIYSVYAPVIETEFTRVLQSGGYFLTVTPAENHLYELKSLIYRQANHHDESKLLIHDLTLVQEQKLTYPMHFNQGEEVINLLSMTPFVFKTTPELLASLAQQQNFSCQADFMIRLYRKN